MQQQEIVDEVKNAPLEMKKVILREALETASEYGTAGVLLSDAVGGASAEATRDAVIKAVKSADGDEAPNVDHRGHKRRVQQYSEVSHR